jgi:hypothetical protein
MVPRSQNRNALSYGRTAGSPFVTPPGAGAAAPPARLRLFQSTVMPSQIK